MSCRKEYAEISAQIEELNARSKKLQKQEYDLLVKQQELSLRLLLEEQILSQNTWSIFLSDENNIYFRCDVKSSDFPELQNFFESNYHCYTRLEKNIDLSFDDGAITIDFSRDSNINEFVKKHNLKFSYSDISFALQTTKDKLNQLENLNKLFE